MGTPAKPWWQSKTLWVNGLSLAIFTLGLVLDNAGVLALSPTTLTLVGMALSVLNVGLRLVTATPIAGLPAATPHGQQITG